MSPPSFIAVLSGRYRDSRHVQHGYDTTEHRYFMYDTRIDMNVYSRVEVSNRFLTTHRQSCPERGSGRRFGPPSSVRAWKYLGSEHDLRSNIAES